MKRTCLLGVAPLFLILVAACQSAPASTDTAAVAPGPAVATAEEAAPAATETTEVASAENDVVCRSMKVTGTRFAKRECKTVDAWVEYDTYTNQNAKEATDKYQRLGTGSSVSTN
tara:strand:- start:999 stop:1343 length:345 start_codon:yes stop_codon:yes gene_type:complete